MKQIPQNRHRHRRHRRHRRHCRHRLSDRTSYIYGQLVFGHSYARVVSEFHEHQED